MKLCTRVRLERIKHGMTQKELEKRASVHVRTIQKCEAGARLGDEARAKIESALGLMPGGFYKIPAPEHKPYMLSKEEVIIGTLVVVLFYLLLSVAK